MSEPLATAPDLETKDDYYKDYSRISFSSLKVFSRCETLYRDLFVTKTYEEPEYDYFTYGKLVDAMVSEPDGFIEKNFVRVDRKVDPEKALEIENKIKGIEAEIKEKTQQMEEKVSTKEQELVSKINELEAEESLTKTKEAKLEKLRKERNDITIDRASFFDKTLLKGIDTRKASIAEFEDHLKTIKQLASKIQVTNSIWINAEETADAIKAHPAYSNMEWNQATSQQIFLTQRNGIPRKGKLDHLKLSPALTKIYAIYAADQMTLEELHEQIRTSVHPQDMWAIITDVKTCRDIALIEPFNKHYRGQLGFYQDLVSDTLLIPVEKIKCRILVADKLSNDFKKCELFEFTQDALDELKSDVEAWAQIWWQRVQAGEYISAKAKDGWHQKCFTCSECRFCPFTTRPGEPVMVAGPRFESNGEPAPLVEEVSTADAVLDY